MVGTYTWHASYSGDGLNNGAIDDGTNESVTTIKSSPAISTSASETAGGVVGTSVLSDSATISGGYNVSGGSITFTLTAPDNSTTTVGTVPVSAAGTYNAPTVLATQVGTYTWHASYSGDGLNNGAIDDGTNESVTTVKASPSIATSASVTNGGICNSSTTSDSATLSGGYNISGGTITFTVTLPNNSTITVGTVTVSGAGTYSSPSINATQVGTYVWHASYSGDGLNNGAVDNGVHESVTIVSASGSISGTKYLDVTGNGLTPDDTPMSGVKIYLDTNNDGSWESGEPYQITGASGTYSFTGLNAGTYVVREVTPSGYVRTAPTLSDNYTINLGSGVNSVGNNFANADVVRLLLAVQRRLRRQRHHRRQRSARQHERRRDGRSHVHRAGGPGAAPRIRWSAIRRRGPRSWPRRRTSSRSSTSTTGVFGPGNYTLTVTIPHSYYQIDFVCGNAIDQFGPANSNIFYSAQNRLISADNDGTHAVLTNGSTLSGFVYVDSNCDGQVQITERVISGAIDQADRHRYQRPLGQPVGPDRHQRHVHVRQPGAGHLLDSGDRAGHLYRRPRLDRHAGWLEVERQVHEHRGRHERRRHQLQLRRAAGHDRQLQRQPDRHGRLLGQHAAART